MQIFKIVTKFSEVFEGMQLDRIDFILIIFIFGFQLDYEFFAPQFHE